METRGACLSSVHLRVGAVVEAAGAGGGSGRRMCICMYVCMQAAVGRACSAAARPAMDARSAWLRTRRYAPWLVQQLGRGVACLQPPHRALPLHNPNVIGVAAHVADGTEGERDRREVVGEEVWKEPVEVAATFESDLPRGWRGVGRGWGRKAR